MCSGMVVRLGVSAVTPRMRLGPSDVASLGLGSGSSHMEFRIVGAEGGVGRGANLKCKSPGQIILIDCDVP